MSWHQLSPCRFPEPWLQIINLIISLSEKLHACTHTHTNVYTVNSKPFSMTFKALCVPDPAIHLPWPPSVNPILQPHLISIHPQTSRVLFSLFSPHSRSFPPILLTENSYIAFKTQTKYLLLLEAPKLIAPYSVLASPASLNSNLPCIPHIRQNLAKFVQAS